MFKVPGQRWLLNIPGERIIAEITPEGIARCIQIIDKSGPYVIGDSMNVDPKKSIWEYLAGQDKPKD